MPEGGKEPKRNWDSGLLDFSAAKATITFCGGLKMRLIHQHFVLFFYILVSDFDQLRGDCDVSLCA
jgi:hypothetical protein